MANFPEEVVKVKYEVTVKLLMSPCLNMLNVYWLLLYKTLKHCNLTNPASSASMFLVIKKKVNKYDLHVSDRWLDQFKK